MSTALAPAVNGLDELEARLAELQKSKDPGDVHTAHKIRSIVERVKTKRANMSPPGSLGLPPLLEQRRWEYNITDGAFAVAALFDRIYVHQVEQVQGLTHIPEGRIHKIDQAERREKESSVQGVLVAAGMTALDSLRSHGVELGDMVEFAFHAPLRKRIDATERGDEFVLLLQAGDLIGDFDLAERLRSGKLSVAYNMETTQHELFGDEAARIPRKPWTREDY